VSATAALVWTAVVAVAVGTWAFRASFVFLFGYLAEVPAWVDRTLRFIPPAIIAAIIAPQLLLADGSPAVALDNERLLAGAAAFVVAWFTEDILATIVAGMAVLWALVFLV